MCGRFTLTASLDDLQAAFPGFEWPPVHAPRFNIAPSQPVLAIPNDGSRRAGFFVWGLVPAWARDPAIGSRLINARAETLAEKPAFRGSYRHHRCLILADGFYEWKREPGGRVKTPYFIRLKGGRPFAFAGLWDRWQAPDGGELLSCAIVTTQANALMRPIHERMPVLLTGAACDRWLDPAPRRPDELRDLLTPFPAGEMEAYAVSTLVNSPANDRPECIRPA